MNFLARIFKREPDAVSDRKVDNGALSKTPISNQFGNYALVVSDPPTDYEKWLIASQGGSVEIVSLCRALLGARGTFVDVGANIGSISAPIALNGHQVFAVEMIPQNCLKLFLMAEANGIHDMEIAQLAASDQSGFIAYTGREAWGEVNLSGRGNQAVRLPLDSLLTRKRLTADEGDRSLVIKIDVEGHELAVLRGLRQTISKYRPFIIFESKDMDDLAAEAFEAKRELERCGYSLYLIRHDILIPRSSAQLQEGLVSDFLAVPSEAINWHSGLPNDIRELSDAERKEWIAEMANSDSEPHRKHALKFNADP